MKYELASSSMEEGEITEEGIPYYKSYLQYYYYPLTTKYIGRNSVPHYMNYKGDGISTKLKKELKADYPYISFSILDRGKAFFDNNFLYVMDCPVDESPLTVKEIKSNYKEYKKLEKKSPGENRYDLSFQRFFFQKEDPETFVGQNIKKAFLFEDRVLEALDNKNAFIFFRVATTKAVKFATSNLNDKTATEDLEKNDRMVTKYAFEEIFYSKSSFYEYLELYKDEVVKNLNSEEIRSYTSESAIFFVFSSTTFKYKDTVRRIYSGIDCAKNTDIIFNKEGPCIIDSEGIANKNVKYIQGFELPDSDYVINDKKIYKISNEGIEFEFQDIVYDDFIKTRWTNL